MAVLAAAMRVVSRKPPAMKRFAVSACGLPSTCAARAQATTWGRWLVRATRLSCVSASSGSARAPMASTREASRVAASSAPSGAHSAQVALRYRPARAWANPARSEPAIGWPPTKKTPAGSAVAAAFMTMRLVLPTSVTTAPGAAISDSKKSCSITVCTGVHSTIRSAPRAASRLAARRSKTGASPTRRVAASSRVSARRAMPERVIRGKVCRRSSARLPPSRPRPTMLQCEKDMPVLWRVRG